MIRTGKTLTIQTICGDCIDVLPTLRAHHYRTAIADPPYIIGGTSIGKPRSKAGTWADMVNAATWYATWFDAVARCLTQDGWLLVFGNWRSLPTYICASARSSALTPQSCMVWDKDWIGTAGPAQLRPTWELVLFLGMERAKIRERGCPDLLRWKWMASQSGSTGHPAEKPSGLIRRLLEIADPTGGPVVDPFMGRGSSGLAALDLGREYCGIEVDPGHHAEAEKVLSGHAQQLQLGE